MHVPAWGLWPPGTDVVLPCRDCIERYAPFVSARRRSGWLIAATVRRSASIVGRARALQSGAMGTGRSRAFVGLLIAFALAIGEGGCAIIMQQPPRENRASGEVPVCSTSRGGVALDGLVAALLGAGAVAALAGDEPGVALGVGAVGGIYAWSAVTGYRSAGACEEALTEYKMELAARRSPPPPATAGAERPLGPPIEQAAAPVDEPEAPAEPPPAAEDPPPAAEDPPPAAEDPPPAAETPPPAAPSRASRDWSDFWVEVPK
jgi:hypothetical protein